MGRPSSTRCVSDDATGDDDADGICGDRDICLGTDAAGDLDLDGICDNDDLCFGDDGWLWIAATTSVYRIRTATAAA